MVLGQVDPTPIYVSNPSATAIAPVPVSAGTGVFSCSRTGFKLGF